MSRMSSEQYQQFLARTSPASVIAGSVALTACESEAQLHEDVRQECAARGWLLFTGSMAHRTHRTVGEPDMTILCQHGRTLFVELKARQTKISVDQQGVINWAAKLGHVVYVVRSIEQFRQLIIELNL